MTKNNLREHLDWLLRREPFTPFLQDTAPGTKISQTVTVASDVSTTQPRGPLTSSSKHEESSQRHVKVDSQEDEFLSPLSPARPVPRLELKDMARLQSTGKPSDSRRLLSRPPPGSSQPSASLTPHNPGISYKDEYSAVCVRNIGGKHMTL